MDGSGGGNFGQGSATDYWSSGYEGVRVTIVTTSGSQVASPVDYTNVTNLPATIYHFGKVNKLSYITGKALTFYSNGYDKKQPVTPLPTIITSGGGNHIAALKKYFTNEGFLKMVCNDTGFDYNQLIGGQYKLLIEPIAYFHFQGQMIACTATEAALYDAVTQGLLWRKMNSLTHKNLPFAMFLEHSDLGITAYTGDRTATLKDNALIVRQLGVGIVSFDGQTTVENPNPTGGDYTFRTDTDVILSIYFQNTTGNDITPDDNATIDLNIGGQIYHREFVCPAGESQLVWVKWHTPSTAQKVPITATSPQIPSLNKTLTADIQKIEEVPPPDPTYYDKNYGFVLESPRDFGSNTSAEWSEWYAYKVFEPGLHEHDWYEYVPDHPEWWDLVPNGDYWTNIWPCTEETCDTPSEHTRWEFELNRYSANLQVDFSIKPNDRSTAYQSGGNWIMKSGYGVQAECQVVVSTMGMASSYDVTPVQNVVALFSEFGYKLYDRFLVTSSSLTNGYRATWNFKQNEFSYYNSRVHFTPLWYPDNTNYVVEAAVFDCWTPGGQLYTTVSDQIQIYKSCLDDWYIHSVK